MSQPYAKSCQDSFETSACTRSSVNPPIPNVPLFLKLSSTISSTTPRSFLGHVNSVWHTYVDYTTINRKRKYWKCWNSIINFTGKKCMAHGVSDGHSLGKVAEHPIFMKLQDTNLKTLDKLTRNKYCCPRTSATLNDSPHDLLFFGRNIRRNPLQRLPNGQDLLYLELSTLTKALPNRPWC